MYHEHHHCYSHHRAPYSPLAVRMITQIQSLLGFHLEHHIWIAPTIAELVLHPLTAGNSLEDALNVLLLIQPRDDTSHPLFCVHHGFVTSWGYIGLSKHLHPDQPIYGLQARGSIDGGVSVMTLRDMALDQIEEIRRIQRYSPRCLLGYSFGSSVVPIIASHLERQGDQVVLLALMHRPRRFHGGESESN